MEDQRSWAKQEAGPKFLGWLPILLRSKVTHYWITVQKTIRRKTIALTCLP